MSVTQKDIAARVGVSQSLVARVLKGYPQIADETQQKVLAVAAEMGYSIHTNGEARALAARRFSGRTSAVNLSSPKKEGFKKSRELTGFIGLVGAAFSRERRSMSYWMDLAGGVQQVMDKAERRVVLLETQSTFGWDNVDGVLVLDRRLENIKDWVAPDVDCISLLNILPGVTHVVADEYDAGKRAAQHLLELGHCRIAFLIQEERRIPQLRFSGYRDALRDAGIEVEPSWVKRSDMDADQDGYVHWGRTLMDDWLRDGWHETGCTALIAQNDGVAAGALLALREACIEVPRQVSVVGFDGTNTYDHLAPQLTSVEIPLHQIGITAAEVLLSRIWNRQNGIPQENEADIVLPTKMKIRQSTAPLGK